MKVYIKKNIQKFLQKENNMIIEYLKLWLEEVKEFFEKVKNWIVDIFDKYF